MYLTVLVCTFVTSENAYAYVMCSLCVGRIHIWGCGLGGVCD